MSNLQDIVVKEMKVKPQIDVETEVQEIKHFIKNMYNHMILSNH